MKICAIICELNPLHNGHLVILREAKRLSGADLVVCIMSGQFTQRGEMCRTDKYLRAKHAILGGADAVLELPTPFACAPAEIFAKGGIKIASLLNGELALAFGCERGTKEDFIAAARILNEENDGFKNLLYKHLDSGESHIKSRAAAFAGCGGDPDMLCSPNNILGVEYVKAAANLPIEILPVKRVEGTVMNLKCRPAHTIRKDIALAKTFMPEYSLKDYLAGSDNKKRFEQVCMDALFFADKNDLKRVYGCTEGLENRLKNLVISGLDYDGIVTRAAGKRYTEKRIQRIMCENMLCLYGDEVNEFLASPTLPVNLLAVKKERAADVAEAASGFKAEGSSGERLAELMGRAYLVWDYLSGGRSINRLQKTLYV